MKGRKTIIIQLVIGLVFMAIGWLVQIDYYSTLIFATGLGAILSALIRIARILYWQNPRLKDEYEQKQYEAHIDSIDERKQYLRMKAGYVTYQIMTVCLILLAFLLALFRADSWIIAMVFLLFVFQWIAGVIAYRRLEKRL